MMNRTLNEMERCLDSQLWHACAGGLVQMPTLNSKVFYFPQGHAEHANQKIDFHNFPIVPHLILCRVSGIKLLADKDADEVYAKIRLVPMQNNEYDFDDDGDGLDKCERQDHTPASFAKTLTQSDANNGGGFSVPRYCAETIFPPLDYSAIPPVQTLTAKDVHGVMWKFRHIYRGTPRRHLLTTGWSNFVNQKKLVAGDSIVFLRAENGELCVGIRRAKREFGGGSEPSSGWKSLGGNPPTPLVGYSSFFTENFNDKSGNWCEVASGRGRVKAVSVVEAAALAAKGKPFEVVYFPRASAPQFCVKASSVCSAMRIQWCAGMRFKMPFETEDSSCMSWFMGTISSVQVDDPIHWPNSPWKVLLVAWDEPDLLQNVKRVSPWLVELVPSVHPIPLAPFSPPRKKVRVPQPRDFPFIGQFTMAPFPNNPLRPYSSSLCCVPDDNSTTCAAGIQGARHAHFGLPSSDHQLSTLPIRLLSSNLKGIENTSRFLTVGISSYESNKTTDCQKPKFLLFGQPILTEDQISQSFSSDRILDKTQNLSDGSGSTVVQNSHLENTLDDGKSDFGLRLLSS